MKVLIATPTYGDGPLPETAASIGAQIRGGREWRQYRSNPYSAPDKRNVLAQYQAIRADFLSGHWDALVTVEHDMQLPPGAVDLLLEAGAPVAYGVYLLRHGSHVVNAWEYVGERNLGESLTLARFGRPTGVRRVSGVGNGCTLIRREVVERFPFHDGGSAGQSPDLPFAVDCVRANVLQVAHFGVLCGHFDDGRWLWPYADEWGARVKVMALQAVVAGVDGRSVRMEAGQVYEVPHNDAIHLERGGYATRFDAGNSDAAPAKPQGVAQPKSRKSRSAKRPQLDADIDH